MAPGMTACPQLIYTSASRTLEGPGFGVFALSPTWPRSLGTSRSSLGSLVGQPTDGDALGLLHRAGGRLAYRKVPISADDFGRAGNYVVQLLWDGDSRLVARDVLALHRCGGFLDALPSGAEPSRDAPDVPVPPGLRSVPVLSADEIDALVPCLAAVLAAIHAGAGVVLMREWMPTGRSVAEVVFDVLPRALTSGVSVHVRTAETMGDAAAVRVLVGSYQDRHGGAAGDENCARAARALLEAAAKGDLCPDGVERLGELDAWLFADTWMELEPASLTEPQVSAVLASTGAGRWLGSPRAASVATALAVQDAEVEKALRAAVARDPAARSGVRAVELSAVLRALFDGGPTQTTDFAGLTQGDLCAGFIRELALGRRLPRVGSDAALLVEQALGLGHDVPLVGLSDDTAGLAALAARRPLVRKTLLREWSSAFAADRWTHAHDELLGELLLFDADWFGSLCPITPEPAMTAGLRRVAQQMSARQVERLAVVVASSQVAGRGWALRCVLFPSRLPADEAAEIVRAQFVVLARDDGWPRALARETAAQLRAATDGPDPPGGRPKRRRRR
jgi:hypothetical protein